MKEAKLKFKIGATGVQTVAVLEVEGNVYLLPIESLDIKVEAGEATRVSLSSIVTDDKGAVGCIIVYYDEGLEKHLLKNIDTPESDKTV